jgi:cytochrome c-type biogenesis protein CcmH/NrfG
VNDYPTSLPFYRLLGDAYMDNGQLQKAVETYRRALDNL